MIHNNIFSIRWVLCIGSLLLALSSYGDDISDESSSPSLEADRTFTQVGEEVVITVINPGDFLDQPFVSLWIVAEEETPDGEKVREEIDMEGVSDLSSKEITFTRLRQGVRYVFSLEAMDADGGISSIEVLVERQPNEDDNQEEDIIIDTNDGGEAVIEVMDEDGDGLIEISDATELNAVRYQPDGRGRRLSAGGELNTSGCPDTGCIGYELAADISLADYKDHDGGRGWRPIGSDVSTRVGAGCRGVPFSGIFEGNNRTISGLRIVRPFQQCIGLFNRVTGEVRNLKLLADRVEGWWQVGGLAGDGAEAANFINVMVVLDELEGYDQVGGLVGRLKGSSRIISSLAIVNSLRARHAVGGLVGNGERGYIASSFAMVDSLRPAGNGVGGLVGKANDIDIMSSYAVTGSLTGSNRIGGLVGRGSSTSTNIVSSYALSGPLSGGDETGGLIGGGGADIDHSYWDMNISVGTGGTGGKTSHALVSPEDYSGIYDSWNDPNQIVDEAIWCDSNANGLIEPTESTERGEDNFIWSFGSSRDYPAIRCSPLSEAEQRSWWHINEWGILSLDQPKLDTMLGRNSGDSGDGQNSGNTEN